MLEYGSPPWRGYGKSHLKRFQIIQNRFLKLTLKLSLRTGVHRLAGFDSIENVYMLLIIRRRTV